MSLKPIIIINISRYISYIIQQQMIQYLRQARAELEHAR